MPNCSIAMKTEPLPFFEFCPVSSTFATHLFAKGYCLSFEGLQLL